MLSAERSLVVPKTQAEVWSFVADMGNWARQMPGYISHEAIDENVSVWTVLVNLGPFQRPVVIDVEVTNWSPPSDVLFNIKGRIEPFQGGGRFHTESRGGTTEIHLQFEVEPTGPLATMLTGLARPVLVRVANEFSANLGQALCGSAENSSGELRSKEITRKAGARSWYGRLTSWWGRGSSKAKVEQQS